MRFLCVSSTLEGYHIIFSINKIYLDYYSKQTNEIACFQNGRLNVKINSQKRFQSSKTEKCSRKKNRTHSVRPSFLGGHFN